LLGIELFVFVRSLPRFSANIFEELERIRPYLQILHPKKNEEPASEQGWSLVYDGKLELPNGSFFERGDILYHSQNDRLKVLEDSTLIFFSESQMDKFLREEPELGVSYVDDMRAMKLKWDRTEL
jgi:hypothetical protein